MDIQYKNTKYTLKFGSGQGLTRGVAILGSLMIFAFVLSQTDKNLFYPLFGFIPSLAIGGLQIWQFFTANFMHGSLTHLLFNLIGLFMFGAPVEKKLGEKEFIKYFLICGLGGYVLVSILWVVGIIPNNLSVGASAGIYGLLLAFSLLFPRDKILLFFFIPMEGKWLALIFGGLELILSISNTGINHIGHLGGLLVGLLYFLHVGGTTFLRRLIYK